MCIGFSVSRCDRNSLLMYSSPSRRICGTKYFRCARSRRLYSGIGGSKAKGAGFSPLVEPIAVGFASSRNDSLMTDFWWFLESEGLLGIEEVDFELDVTPPPPQIVRPTPQASIFHFSLCPGDAAYTVDISRGYRPHIRASRRLFPSLGHALLRSRDAFSHAAIC